MDAEGVHEDYVPHIYHLYEMARYYKVSIEVTPTLAVQGVAYVRILVKKDQPVYAAMS